MYVLSKYIQPCREVCASKISRVEGDWLLYGYNVWEAPTPIKIDDIKNNFRIVSIEHDDALYRNAPISCRLPISLTDVAPIIPNPDPTPNKIGGILKRFCRNPGLNRKFLRGLRAFTQKWCRKNIRRFRASDDLTFETWINGTDYPATRKEQLKIIHDDLVKNQFKFGTKLRRRSTVVKSFVKDESYPDFKYPRLINSRCDEFKVFSGPLFDAIGKRLGERPEFVKYIPVVERPKYLYERLGKNSRYFSSDYSSFEAHFSKEMMMNCEFVLYKYITDAVPAVRRKMAQIMSVLKGENQIMFKDVYMTLLATRMSGEMNTSVGNGFSNLMINSYVASLHDCGKITICVEGDDGIMCFERPNNAPTEADFKSYGLIIKLIESDNLADLSFCGQVFDPDDGIVITDPFEALVNVGFTRKWHTKANRSMKLGLLRARALSMLYQYNGCPMLTSFALRVIELTSKVVFRKRLIYSFNEYERDVVRLALDLHINPHIPPPNSPCRSLFSRLYGVSIPHQLAFESAMMTLELDCEIDISAIIAYPKNNMLMCQRYMSPKDDFVPGVTCEIDYVSYLNSMKFKVELEPGVTVLESIVIPWNYRMMKRFTHHRKNKWKTLIG